MARTEPTNRVGNLQARDPAPWGREVKHIRVIAGNRQLRSLHAIVCWPGGASGRWWTCFKREAACNETSLCPDNFRGIIAQGERLQAAKGGQRQRERATIAA